MQKVSHPILYNPQQDYQYQTMAPTANPTTPIQLPTPPYRTAASPVATAAVGLVEDEPVLPDDDDERTPVVALDALTEAAVADVPEGEVAEPVAEDPMVRVTPTELQSFWAMIWVSTRPPCQPNFVFPFFLQISSTLFPTPGKRKKRKKFP